MFCISCGKEMPNGAVFCPYCGAKASSNTGALVEAKCTNCGAPLKVDPSVNVATCPYCKHEYIVQQAIQNYMITVTSNTMNIQHADVRMVAGHDFYSLLQCAKDCDSAGHVIEAIQYYRRALDYRPLDNSIKARITTLQNGVYYLGKYTLGIERRTIELRLGCLISRKTNGSVFYVIPLQTINGCYWNGKKCCIAVNDIQYEYKVRNPQYMTGVVLNAMNGVYPVI